MGCTYDKRRVENYSAYKKRVLIAIKTLFFVYPIIGKVEYLKFNLTLVYNFN